MPSPIPEGTADTAPRAPNLQCESCGYDIRGLASADRCPECGTRVAESMPERRIGTPWQRGRGLAAYFSTLTGAIFQPSSLLRIASCQPGRDLGFYLLNALLSAAMPMAATSFLMMQIEAVAKKQPVKPLEYAFFFLSLTIVSTIAIAFMALIIFYGAWIAAAVTTRRFDYEESRLSASAASSWLVLGSAICATFIALAALAGPVAIFLFPLGLLAGWTGYAVACYRNLTALRFANWPPPPAF